MFNSFKPTPLKQFWDLLTNRWAISCLGLILLQQVIESSATIWLVALMKKVTTHENFFPYLYLYLASVVIPYLPGCVANIIKISWKQIAQRNFVDAFIDSNRDQITEWNNKGIKEEKLSVLTTEGPNAIHALIDYVFEYFGYIVSVILNIFALSIVIDPLFGVAYAFSLAVVVGVIKMKKQRQHDLTHDALTARLGLYQSLLAAWDNVLLGNRYNFKLWKYTTMHRLESCLQKNVQLERFDQILAILICLLTSVPSLIVVIYYAYKHQDSMENLSAFLVALPILFLIITYTYQTLSLAFRWNMHKSKILEIYKSLQPLVDSHSTMEKKVKWDKIHLISSSTHATDTVSLAGPPILTSHADLMQWTKRSGRITLRGENGAGKSTLLMLTKNVLSDRAFFLPTHNQLSFVSETVKHSTGESLKNRLIEILEHVDADVLLLDEWDANLDSTNQERLSNLIDLLAEKKCVIEVRHR